ncbi:MAG: divalent-cation tolerance protein CutA [Candidatus Aenigmarchaeota archaeon]|nr:divalent-cation tolerance protein CutA [Candidatus Aenigmarchaeota archaeon]MCX8190734.1 divalent-cation tolerance protein CutA [Candidatus Aenigmarchaeota archaeon]MDW8159982.1 divalent-cation tolerance protein CutA [Candidatus Aenigmarchaeota archaeon]
MKKIFLLYVVFPNEKEARKVGKYLVEKNFVACVNLFPVKSLYKWKNRIEESNEVVMIAKVEKDKVEKVVKEIERKHPYEIPFIAKFSVEVCEKYFDWMKKLE